MTTPLHFNAFVMNTNSHIHHGLWRRPDAGQVEFNDVRALDRPREAARGREVRRDLLRRRHRASTATPTPTSTCYIREGLQIPSNDPIRARRRARGAHRAHRPRVHVERRCRAIRSTSPARSRRSTTSSNGRIAWNIVTGLQDNGARNFGYPRLTDHTERYAWAEEYLDVTYKLWEGSWDEDALLKDRERGVYADPSKIHKINHESERYRCRARTCRRRRRSARRVLFQAGSSSVGARVRRAQRRGDVHHLADAGARRAAHRRHAAPRRRGRAPARGHQVLPGPVVRHRRHRGGGAGEGRRVRAVRRRSTGTSRTRPSSTRPVASTRPTRPSRTSTRTPPRAFTEWAAKAITDREPVIRDVAVLISRVDPHRRHARADRRRARGVAGGRRRRHQRHQLGDPRLVRRVRREGAAGAARPRPRAARLRHGCDPARTPLRGAATQRPSPGGEVPRRLRRSGSGCRG